MKYLTIVTIFIMGILGTYETEHFVGEEGLIIAGEGVAIAQQHNKPLPPDFFVEDVIEKGLCFVGQTLTIKATLQKARLMFGLGFVLFETNNDSVVFIMDTLPFLKPEQVVCIDYYKDGGTYNFPIYIGGISIYEWDDPSLDAIIERHGKRNTPIFVVSSVVMITEELRKELRAANCWLPDRR